MAMRDNLLCGGITCFIRSERGNAKCARKGPRCPCVFACSQADCPPPSLPSNKIDGQTDSLTQLMYFALVLKKTAAEKNPHTNAARTRSVLLTAGGLCAANETAAETFGAAVGFFPPTKNF